MPFQNTYCLTCVSSYFGRGVSLHGCSRKVQPLLLTLDEVALPDLECEVALLSPPEPVQPICCSKSHHFSIIINLTIL